MANISVEIPGQLKEELKIKAYEQKVKISDVIRNALWKALEDSDPNSVLSRGRTPIKNTRLDTLEEQVYFTRCVVEHIGLIMEDGGKEFIANCHIKKDQLLKSNR